MLQTEMQEVIKKNLPAEVGDVLRQELAAGKLAQERLLLIEEQNKELTKRVDKYRLREVEMESVLNREKAVTERENKAEVESFRLKAEESEKRAILAVLLVEKVFRSPVYSKNITESKNSYDNGSSKSESGSRNETVLEV